MPEKRKMTWNAMGCFLRFIGTCQPQMEPLGIGLQKVPDVCNPILINPSLVKEGTNYMREKTNDASELERASVSGRLALNGVSVGDVKASLGANGQLISCITLEISNAWILYADDVTLSNTADVLVRDPKCVESIGRRRLAGYEITALVKVLIADLKYTSNNSGNLPGDAKASLLKQIGAQLRASYDQGNQTLVKGGGLTFGFSVASISPVAASVGAIPVVGASSR